MLGRWLIAISMFAICAIAQAQILPAGTIILFRHANAPGVGDPPGFVLNDCKTQRNLDDIGRAQAEKIGRYLRHLKVKATAVWSSQWCRALDTARLINMGPVQPREEFNSFFSEPKKEAPQLAAAKQALLGFNGSGVLVVVSHQVVITGLTGIYPASGEGILLTKQGDKLQVVGRIQH